MEVRKACIAMVPSNGLSHIIAFVEFAKQLVQQYSEYFHVTLIIPTNAPPTPSIKAILNNLPPNIDFIILPQVNILDLPQNTIPGIRMKLTSKRSLPFLHNALSSLISSQNHHLVALVCELFSVDALDVAKQFNLKSYFFSGEGATSFLFAHSFPKLDENESIPFTETTRTVTIPGCAIPFQVKDLPVLILGGKSSESYKSFLDICQRLQSVDAVILNSYTNLEVKAIRALQENEASKVGPCVYPIGPIFQTGLSSQENGSARIKWLENQAPRSVLYISFGSGGTISHDQLIELAFGLELSGHKFMWVLRPPSESSHAAYFVKQKEDPLHYLPPGFLDRTKEKGLVIPSWAPQIEILNHKSIGGFMSHCGWKSVLESVFYGVPVIALPLFAEQGINAVLLTDELKVAVRPIKDEQSNLVKREEIVRVIKRIMEGDEGLEMRERIKKLSDAAADALSKHGSSNLALSALALKWKNF